MKTLIIPSNLKQAQNSNCDGVILGIDKLSINMPFYIDIDDIKQIKNKEIFICLNKNMHNIDLPFLKETLINLSSYSIRGVIFYDIAIPNLCKKIDINYELVWSQEHMTNNYYTIRFWQEHNVNYTWVSSDITLKEMNEIKENSTAKLMVTVFGYLPIFASKRHLVRNYINTFQLQDKSNIHFMEKEGKQYPLIDNQEGTIVYTDFILDGLRETLALSYDYIILNSFMIEEEKFSRVLEIFQQVDENNIELLESQLYELFDNVRKGFFYEETIYKVK